MSVIKERDRRLYNAHTHVRGLWVCVCTYVVDSSDVEQRFLWGLSGSDRPSEYYWDIEQELKLLNNCHLSLLIVVTLPRREPASSISRLRLLSVPPGKKIVACL